MAENTIGSMLCPYCSKLISKTSETCIHCGKKNPKMMTSVPFLQNILGGKVSFVQGITTVCIALYVLALFLDALTGRLRLDSGGFFFGFLSPSVDVTLLLGQTGAYSVILQGKWWTLITAMYLHGSLIHILFNFLWIRQLGPQVEELFGSARFFIIYTLSGVIGFMASTFIGVYFGIRGTLGASGAIFGLFGAIVYYGKDRGGSFGKNIYRQTLQWAILLFAFGFFMSRIDNFAHGGGFIGGYVVASLLGYQEKARENITHRWIALACLAMTGLAFLFQIF